MHACCFPSTVQSLGLRDFAFSGPSFFDKNQSLIWHHCCTQPRLLLLAIVAQRRQQKKQSLFAATSSFTIASKAARKKESLRIDVDGRRIIFWPLKKAVSRAFWRDNPFFPRRPQIKLRCRFKKIFLWSNYEGDYFILIFVNMIWVDLGVWKLEFNACQVI